jgi:hypothetical protein
MTGNWDVILGSSCQFGDNHWHVGVFRDGSCFSWASFPSKLEAEMWMQNPILSEAAFEVNYSLN